MKYILIAGLLSLGLLSNAGAKGISNGGCPPSGQCTVNRNDQDARPRQYKLRTFQDNRRNYKWYDNAREAETLSNDFCFNGGFNANEY
jgi:hypothetical protein